MKLFSLMVLLCASLGGYAQDIKGRVVEQENGKKVGLPGANAVSYTHLTLPTKA